ncbi:uncharacterized protein NPIL_702661 [Nephila pilipes]|uniref:Uncharacterized protein n=1 Tax=Nephila pilipes TaxID=299642 RepID=A0A8X6N0P3_NEPPI|nr:uncharacterized protein NPIL_702661 [Nephila pilipes]
MSGRHNKELPFDDAMLFRKKNVRNIQNNKWAAAEKLWKNYDRNNSFIVLFNTALFFGLPLSSSVIKTSSNDIGMLEKLWCYVLVALKTVMFIISVTYTYHFVPALSICVTFYGYIVCGYITTLLFFRKRKKLYVAIKNLIHFSSVLNPGAFIGSRYIKLQLISFFASIFIMMACVTTFFFYELPDYIIQKIYIPPFVDENSRESFRNIVRVCIICTFGLSVTTAGYSFILCCNLYETMGKLIQMYGEKLKEQCRHMAWNVATIIDDISIFKNLAFRVYETDKAVNPYVLWLYGALICGFFNTVSVLVINDVSYKTAPIIVYIVWIFVTATTVLLVMSYYGSNITDKGDEVKRQMIEYSDKFIRFSPPLSAMQTFHFLFELVMKANMVVTGGGVFTVNFGLILSIASVMVTYGVLILQLDQN